MLPSISFQRLSGEFQFHCGVRRNMLTSPNEYEGIVHQGLLEFLLRTTTSLRVESRQSSASFNCLTFEDVGVDTCESVYERVKRMDPQAQRHMCFAQDQYFVKVIRRKHAARAMMVALRSLRAGRAIAPLQSPKPIGLLLPKDKPNWVVLMSEHCQGETLSEICQRDLETHGQSLIDHLLSMERKRVVHTDFTPRNLLFSSNDWIILDLESLYPGLAGLIRRRNMARYYLKFWHRFFFQRQCSLELVEDLFKRWAVTSNLVADGQVEWRKLCTRWDEVTRGKGS